MALTEKAKEARKEYIRQWQHNNPEKVKQYKETYWNRKAEKLERKTEDGEGKTGL